MALVPTAQRTMVTDHDAFGALAARYGVTIVGAVIPARTTQAQPSAGELSRLAAVIRRTHVRAVFPETSVNPRLARAIARQTGASSDYELYGDTLGPAGSDGATYVQSEVHNADAMLRGFTGGARGCTIASR
jgi:ABC-type Zn uptake system ZnuABC Zn-binding protein ZnuA